MYLLDTNTVIKFLDGTLPTNALDFLNNVIDTECSISVITEIETLGFNFTAIEDENVMQLFIDNTNVIELSSLAVGQTIALRKQVKIKLPDAIIAATAIAYNLTLITSDIKDFKNIPNLNIITPDGL
jgi:hypothetical protein